MAAVIFLCTWVIQVIRACHAYSECCWDGVLLMETGRSTVEGERNTKCVMALYLYASQWTMKYWKSEARCKHQCLLAMTFSPEVRGGQRSCFASVMWPFPRLRKRWESVHSIYHLKGGMHLGETHLTAAWVPLAATALGTGVQRLPIMLLYQSHIFQVRSYERGWIIPAGSFLRKIDFEYLWKLFNDVRTITGCFILAEGYFSFWLRVISAILPLFHSQAIIFPPAAFLRAGILALSLLNHVTVFSQVLKPFYIRPVLPYPFLHLFTSQWTFLS